MIFIKIDGIYNYYEKPITILEAVSQVKEGIEIPRFCYNEKLSIAGNCRMCLVETDYSSKPIASCAISIEEGMEVLTNTVMVKFARESVLEFLLINHPLDCPICDQGGECDSQDITFIYGNDRGRFYEDKRAVKDKEFGSFIATSMTKRIHCTKCVRFLTEVAGTNELGTTGRGYKMEITSYIEKIILSEISGNIIDLCPVGALTSKPYAFKARPWELTHISSIDIIDPLGTNIIIDIRGIEILRILPRFNPLLNDEWIDDRTRFFYDGLLNNRIIYPYIKTPIKNLFYYNILKKKINTKLIATDWETIFLWLKYYFNNILRFNKVKAFLSNYHNIQTITLYKNFCNILGSSNLYYNYNYNINKLILDFRLNYIFSLPLTELNLFDIIGYINFNPRLDSPIFNTKIREILNFKEIDFFNIGKPFNFTYDIDNLGNSLYQFKNLIEGRLSKLLLNKDKNILIIIGLQSFCNINSLFYLFKFLQNNVLKNITICFFSIYNSFITANDVGFINGINSSSLIEYKNKNYIEFINSNNFNKEKKIKKDLYFLLGDNINININKIYENFIIYVGHHGERLASISDIILPTKSFIEKEGLYYTNFQGFYQRTNLIINTSMWIRTDWIIFKNLINLYLLRILKNIHHISSNTDELKNLELNFYTKSSIYNITKVLFKKYVFIPSIFMKKSYEYEKILNKFKIESLITSNILTKFYKFYRCSTRTFYKFFNFFIGLKVFKEGDPFLKKDLRIDYISLIYQENLNFLEYSIFFSIKNYFLPFYQIDINNYNNELNFNFMKFNFLKDLINFNFYFKVYNTPFISRNYSIFNNDIISNSSENLSLGLKDFLLSKSYIWNSEIIK